MAENLTGPPAKEPRVPITVLIRPSSRDWLDQTAKHHGLSRSDVIRASLAVAVKHDRDLVATLKMMGEAS
jgi:hypothetical protein